MHCRKSFDCNLSIGSYEADNLLQYANLYRNHYDNNVIPFDDGACSPFHNENADLPFSLLLPHHISKSKWCKSLDKFAVRQCREASNFEAANMSSVVMNRSAAVIIPTLTDIGISKQCIKEFKNEVKKHRPLRKNGSAVSVFKQQSAVAKGSVCGKVTGSKVQPTHICE